MFRRFTTYTLVSCLIFFAAVFSSFDSTAKVDSKPNKECLFANNDAFDIAPLNPRGEIERCAPSSTNSTHRIKDSSSRKSLQRAIFDVANSSLTSLKSPLFTFGEEIILRCAATGERLHFIQVLRI